MGGAPVSPSLEAERKAMSIPNRELVPLSLSIVSAWVPASTRAFWREKFTTVCTPIALDTTAEMTARWRSPRPMSPVGSDLRMRE